MNKPIKISKLQEMLEEVKNHIGDVEVFGWDSDNGNIKTFPVTGINCEGDHINLTN